MRAGNPAVHIKPATMIPRQLTLHAKKRSIQVSERSARRKTASRFGCSGNHSCSGIHKLERVSTGAGMVRFSEFRFLPFSIPTTHSKSVGMTGFEPATSSSRTTRATKLRYIPLTLRASSPRFEKLQEKVPAHMTTGDQARSPVTSQASCDRTHSRNHLIF